MIEYFRYATTLFFVIMLMNWVGFLFAIKFFDFFAKQCEEQWFWHMLMTLNMGFSTYLFYTDPKHGTSGLDKFNVFIFFGWMVLTYGSKITRAVREFHRNQRMKRGDKC